MTASESNPSLLTRRRLLRDSAVLGAGAYLSAIANPARLLAASGSGRTVAVIGGGVAGLTAAQELAERGFEVTVYERKALGGKARSIPIPGTGTGGRLDLPGEHGFRAEFGFYQNLNDTMRRVPVPGNENGVFDNMRPVGHAMLARDQEGGSNNLTIPIDWRAFHPPPFSKTTPQQVQQSILAALHTGREMPAHEAAFFARQVAIYFTSSDERRFGQWEYESWSDFTRAEQMSEEYRKQFVGGLTRNLAAAKPEEMSVNSTGIVGESFAYNLSHRPDHPDHEIDRPLRPATGFDPNNNDPGDAPDRVLNAPTNEAWIDPWVAELERLGVELRVGELVERMQVNPGGRLGRLHVRDAAGRTRQERPHWVVLAVPVERAIPLLRGAHPSLRAAAERLEQLRTEWMNGVIFYLDRPFPIADGHVNYIESEWALTSISQATHWDRNVAQRYGDGRVRESLSTIISDWSTPGRKVRKPAWACTPDEIFDEVWAQLADHLTHVSERPQPSWVVHRFLDPAISYPAELAGDERIATNDEPLLINTPGSWDDRPEASTAIPNLMLAGTYVRTTMNVETMESACESGRRAARAVLEASEVDAEPVKAFDRWVPPENEPLKRLDAERYRLGLPHVLDRPWVGDQPDQPGVPAAARIAS